MTSDCWETLICYDCPASDGSVLSEDLCGMDLFSINNRTHRMQDIFPPPGCVPF